MSDDISCLDILKQLPIPLLVIDKSLKINNMNLYSIKLFNKLGLSINNSQEDLIYISKVINFNYELINFINGEEKDLTLVKKIYNLDSVLYFEIKFVKINNSDNSSLKIAIILQDITEHKESQISLIEQEAKLSSILNSIPIMMYVIDKNNRIIFWNKECENITGYTKEEATSLPELYKRTYPNVICRNIVFDTVSSYKNNFKDLESNIVCKDGSIKTIAWFSTTENLSISNWFCIKFGIDITRRKNAEKCLIEKTSEFELIFKALPDLYFRVDKNGTYLDCKAQDQNDLYLPPKKFIGKKIEEVMPTEMSIRYKSAIIKSLKTNSLVIVEYQLEIENKINSYEARFLPLSQDEVIIIVRNITKRKQTDEELLKIEKLNSLGTLAGGVAHDFNNILTIILGNISMLKTYSHVDNKVFKKLLDLEKTVLQAKSLTKQLLTFAKGNNPIKKVTYINDVLKETVELSLSGTNVICNLNICNNLSPVEIDIGQISQVINNLIINACQAMPNGGLIHITGRNVFLTDCDILGLKSGNYVKISIKDQGCGISEEILPKIFDPYFTTKKTGNGLGLTSSYSILENHNGKIIVKSKVDRGTIFHIYLPACNSIPIEIKEEKFVISTDSKKILVMDDEPEIRAILKSMLEHLGYIVELARDGSEAITLYKKAKYSSDPFDLVIMDLTIPGGMGGEETIKHLLKFDPYAKAIVSSGYYSGGVIGDYKRHGFKGVINKPYTMEELSNSLNNILSSC